MTHDRSRVITIHAERAFEVDMQSMNLPFEPPMISLGKQPRSFLYWWKLIEYVYSLPSPHEFPHIGPFPADDMRVLRRFVHICEDVARSRLINYPTSWSLGLGDDKEEVSFINAPDAEIMRSGAVVFRQLFVPSEKASFNAVRNLLRRKVRALGADAPVGTMDVLRLWQKAHAEMTASPLPHIGDEVSTARWQHRAPRQPQFPMTTRQLAELFSYGDLIHWGDQAEAFEAFTRSRVVEIIMLSNFLDGMTALLHLYMGFAVVVKRGCGDSPL